MRVLEKPPGGGSNGISTLNFLDWEKDNTVFEYMAAQTGGAVTLTGVDEPDAVARLARVGALLRRLRHQGGARAGRSRPARTSSAKTASPSSATRCGSRSSAATATSSAARFMLDGEPHTVIGVLAGRRRVRPRQFAQIWRPLAFAPENMTRNFHWFGAVARLKPGVTIEQATRPNGRDRRAHRAGLSRISRRAGASRSIVTPIRRRHAAAPVALRAAGGRGHGAADRLRESREPDPRARHRPRARSGDPRVARRRPLAG